VQLLLHLEAEWSEGVKMDCCSAGHNHTKANNPEKKGVSWFALIMILLMAGLIIFSILK